MPASSPVEPYFHHSLEHRCLCTSVDLETSVDFFTSADVYTSVNLLTSVDLEASVKLEPDDYPHSPS